MRETDFLAKLNALLGAHVEGVDATRLAEIVLAAAERIRSGRPPAGCEIVPFVPGRRPIDEAAHPWLGSSDQAALIVDGDQPNVAYLLYIVTGVEDDAV